MLIDHSIENPNTILSKKPKKLLIPAGGKIPIKIFEINTAGKKFTNNLKKISPKLLANKFIRKSIGFNISVAIDPSRKRFAIAKSSIEKLLLIARANTKFVVTIV